jgi:hypothetical protein
VRDERYVYLLRVLDPAAVPAVHDFFRRVHVDVRETDGGMLTASIHGALSPLHAWREVTGYVATWNALNPASPVELVDLSD